MQYNVCFWRAMWCISAAYAVMRCLCLCVCVCLSVCVSVTFVSYVKTNKDIFEFFSPSGSHTILVPYQTRWWYSDGNSLTGASNAGAVGRNRDSEPICLLLTLQQARCCNHCRRWTTATISQVVTIISLVVYTAGIRPPSATRDKVTVSVVLQRESDQARSRTIHNHDRSHVWQQGLTLRWRQQNRIKLYALVNPKLK